ncbi:porin [Teredinibacter haidensis]|uniref:porin n=1 Tax=Teredinibacter haidensis TaxID=2731755 RepID=UPI000948E665|nr:porin [Teredinibacter haidensis]
MLNKRLLTLAFCTLGLSSGVSAEIAFNGFATFAGGLTSSDDETLQGYDNDLSFDQDSKLAIQAQGNLGEGLTAVAQIMAKGSEDWDAKLTWAYIGWEATENIKFLFGRQRAPFYAYSDFLDVSYAYHWITPPAGVYSIPFDSVNGIGMAVNNQLGPMDSTVQVVIGRNRESILVNDTYQESDLSNMVNLNWSLTYDWITFRVAYSQADLAITIDEIDRLTDGWSALHDANATIPNFATEIRTDDGNDTSNFFGAGFNISYEDFIVIAEYTESSTEGSFLQESQEGYYLSLGKRMGAFTPHITYGANEDTPTSTDFLETGLPPAGASVDIDNLVAATQGLFQSTAHDSDYLTLGLRWDFHDSAAFKAEYTMYNDNLLDEDQNLLRFALVTVF